MKSIAFRLHKHHFEPTQVPWHSEVALLGARIPRMEAGYLPKTMRRSSNGTAEHYSMYGLEKNAIASIKNEDEPDNCEKSTKDISAEKQEFSRSDQVKGEQPKDEMATLQYVYMPSLQVGEKDATVYNDFDGQPGDAKNPFEYTATITDPNDLISVAKGDQPHDETPCLSICV